MNMISRILLSATAAIGLTAVVEQSAALPTVGASAAGGGNRSSLKTTAAACNPATATVDLDINNVRARLMTGGDMWWDRGTGTARYEVPKGSLKNSLYAGSVWVAGYDEQNILKVAGQTFRTKGNDYWPGPTQVDATGVNLAPDRTICSEWDKFWKLDASTLIEFRELQRANQNAQGWTRNVAEKYRNIVEWPATGNSNAKGVSGAVLSQLTDSNYLKANRNYAPFIDVNNDGIYDPEKGDYPDILGDQYIWWVFNDMGNVKLQSETVAIGMEVQTSAFAFSSKDFLNDATFVFYKLINRGTVNMNNCYMATWTDADLGFAFDDYIGCDTARSLGIMYNGKSVDGTGNATDYGSSVPMVGVDFFIGPKRRTYGTEAQLAAQFPGQVIRPAPNRPGVFYNEDTLGMSVFNYFNNGPTGPLTDPQNGLEMYRVMTGYNRIGQHLKNDQASCPGSTAYGPGTEINYVWPGNPERAGDWSECQCNTQTGDRRFVHSSGPFLLESGGITNDIIIGACWVPNVGGCPNTSFSRIRAADDMIQDLFDNKFRTISGPEAPRMVVREMDRKLVMYLLNDYGSNNYQEKYGRSDSSVNSFGAAYNVSTPRTRRLARNGDSMYKFEGYRVFQLKNANVKASDITLENGSINQALAREIFVTDIKNGVQGNIINYVANPDKGQGVIDANVMVRLKDSGIQHSFTVTQDAFAAGEDKRLVNYKNYYFVAVAFAYNNYAQFTYAGGDTAQTVTYLESRSAPLSRPIPVTSGMPNPANGDMGTVLNTDYGDGVIIKRLEGIGNGGNAAAFSDETEAQILTAPYQAAQPVYRRGEGPVKIKVVDPRNVVAADWKLFIQGPGVTDTTRGITAATGKWYLTNSLGDIIYSERNLTTQNEQILEKYGLSIDISQVLRPGDSSAANNGLITSDITFTDPNLIWLAGVPDGEQQSITNWIRSGAFQQPENLGSNPCNWADIGAPSNNPDELQAYENLLSGSTLSKATWAPVMLGAVENKGDCGFGVANNRMLASPLNTLPGVDVVFTSDKTKWTKCVVLELQDDPTLSQGGTFKFAPRSHRSWNGSLDANNNPVYSSNPADTGYSYFPGYAINIETGERLNMAFGEDSYLKQDFGDDMLWNPSGRYTDGQGGVVFGGKHYIYVLGTRYDEGKEFGESFNTDIAPIPSYNYFRWMSLPTLAPGQTLLPVSQGLIPTDTRVRIRVTRPYGRYIAHNFSGALENDGYPLFTFSTNGYQKTPITDANNMWNKDKDALMDQVMVTPNPYYGYARYETGRLDTRVRIINLPRRATIHIYSTDGTLIRTLTKDNPNQSFVDWDTRNAKGLSIASGMYLMHVKAETVSVSYDGTGKPIETPVTVGEKVLRWFGAMRPVDLTTY